MLLISLFTPAFYATSILGIKEYNWMWGLSYTSITGYGSRTVFLPAEEPLEYLMPIFLIGFIPFVLFLLCTVALIISANTVRTGRTDAKNRENLWITISIPLFIASIVYIIGIARTTKDYIIYMYEEIYGYPPYGLADFWDVYNPGFAIIAPFIVALLSLAGGILSKTIKPRQEPLFIRQKPGMITKKPFGQLGQVTHEIKFCSSCGYQLLFDGAKFCSNCGNELIYQ
ncbi:MAG: zinc ribbon domain-containing protein [Promethearchaeota archaeon]